MTARMEIPKPKMRAFMLVRVNGVPQFDDPENAPEEMKAMLTEEDLRAMPRNIVARLGMIHRLEN